MIDIDRFLEWYKQTQASKACLKHWEQVSAELSEAFYRVKNLPIGAPIGAHSRRFAERMALKFFELERKNQV